MPQNHSSKSNYHQCCLMLIFGRWQINSPSLEWSHVTTLTLVKITVLTVVILEFSIFISFVDREMSFCILLDIDLVKLSSFWCLLPTLQISLIFLKHGSNSTRLFLNADK